MSPPWRPGRGTIPLDNREIVRLLGWVALVFGVNLLLVLFELWPTLQTIQLGNRMVDSWLSTLFWVAGTVTLAVLALNPVFTSGRRPARYAVIFLVFVVLLAQWKDLSRLLPDFFKSFEATGLAVFPRPTAIFNRPPNYILTPLQTVLVAYGIFKAGRTAPAAVILLALGVALLLIGSHTLWFPFLHETLWSNQDDIGRVDFVSIVGLMVGLAFAIDGLKTRLAGGKSRLLFGVIMAVLLLEGFYLYQSKNLFTGHFRYVQHESPETAFLKTLRPRDRVGWIYDEMHQKYQKGFLPQSLPQALIITYFGPTSFCINGYAILPKAAFEYASKAMPTFYGLDRTRPVNNLVDLAGVKYIFSRRSLQIDSRDLKLIQSTGEFDIYGNPRAFPRVFLVPRVERVPENKLLERLDADDLENLKTVAYLTGDDDASKVGLPAADPVASADLGTVNIVKYEDQCVEIDCRIKRACFLILTDTYHPAWKAYVQGKPLAIHRTDFLFRGVKLPPGHYLLTFTFEAGVYRALFILSCATLLIILLALLGLPLMKRFGRARTPGGGSEQPPDPD